MNISWMANSFMKYTWYEISKFTIKSINSRIIFRKCDDLYSILTKLKQNATQHNAMNKVQIVIIRFMVSTFGAIGFFFSFRFVLFVVYPFACLFVYCLVHVCMCVIKHDTLNAKQYSKITSIFCTWLSWQIMIIIAIGFVITSAMYWTVSGWLADRNDNFVFGHVIHFLLYSSSFTSNSSIKRCQL